MNNGTRPLTTDHRDYDFHKTFSGTVPAHFPEELILDAGLWMPSQYKPDPVFNNPPLPYGCTDYTTADVCADQDGVLYNPMFTEKLTGANAKGGYGIRESLQTAIDTGTQRKDGLIVKRLSYFNIKKYGNLDWFDSIRFAMLTPDRRCTVSWGTPWFPQWEQAALSGIAIVPSHGSENPYTLPWHNSKLVGWKTINGIPYLINKSWQGEKVGDKGYLSFSREEVNSVMEITGTCAFTVTNTDGLDVRTIDTTFYEKIVSIIRNLFTPSVSYSGELTPEQKMSTPTETYFWDTPANARHSVRVICDEEGLPLERNILVNGKFYLPKDIICACIQQESQFDNNAICRNRNKAGKVVSSDWGIAQVNDYYHIGIGKEFPSVSYVVNNPDKAVRWMVEMYKAGKLGLWVSYSSGAYKKWLN